MSDTNRGRRLPPPPRPDQVPGWGLPLYWYGSDIAEKRGVGQRAPRHFHRGSYQMRSRKERDE